LRKCKCRKAPANASLSLAFRKPGRHPQHPEVGVANLRYAAAMPRRGGRNEVSAGLIAFRKRAKPEFLLAHPGGPFWARKDLGAWTIPKGQVDSDDFLAGAQREFTEETGFTAQGPFVSLEPVRQRSGKTVHAFAFEGDFDLRKFFSNKFEMEWPLRSGKLASFPEIDRVGWFGYEEALEKLIAYQRPLLRELMKKLSATK
jgi:predicted NUDIX family NTP pyrophosphohydrolase